MKVALPVWQGRVSPVFDAAKQLTVYEIDESEPTVIEAYRMTGVGMKDRIGHLVDIGVNCLLCGAISKAWQQLLEAEGIEVIPFLTGRSDHLLAAYRTGHLSDERYQMPGCRHHGQPCRQRWRVPNQEE